MQEPVKKRPSSLVEMAELMKRDVAFNRVEESIDAYRPLLLVSQEQPGRSRFSTRSELAVIWSSTIYPEWCPGLKPV